VRPSRAGIFRRALLTGALALVLATPHAGFAEEPAASPVLSWETGEGKSYFIPALEVPAFILGLHLFDRFLSDTNDYDTDWHSIRKNLTSATVIDKDPFTVNQIGHPYQGSIYYGLARSAGLNYWQSLAYTLAGSYLWETFGEKTPPSLNDHIASGIAGSFVGEALFRMASLLLEGGGETPGFWRELGAAVLSPPTGFNRLVFGNRFDAVFPSRNPEVFVRLRLGATVTTNVNNADLSNDVKKQEGRADYYITYGLPGKPGYLYTRPFDYFQFELTLVPNASDVANAIENVAIKGLLVGAKYGVGENYRGVWGIFGSFDYLSPQIFRVSTTALSLGTVAQWWLSRAVAFQAAVFGGVGFGAAGTVADEFERDYHYGVTPQGLLTLRLIFGGRAMLEGTGSQYYVAGPSSGGGVGTHDFSSEIISRGNLGFTLRVFGPHAIGVQYLVSMRNADVPGGRSRHQQVETVSLSYNFLGHTRFGAVEWRPEQIAGR
jgi:hypothetical protein